MDTVTVLVEQDTRSTVGQQDLASRHLHGVSSLYAARADLRGVYAFADVVEESVRWSV
jgi:hypothetical protein